MIRRWANGATYLDRAKTYITMLEHSMDTSFTPWFIDSSTLMIKRLTTSQGYLSTFHNVNAWNAQFMLAGAYWRLEHCHSILGDSASRVATYSSIVQNATNNFVQNAVPLTTPGGESAYNWGYGNYGDEVAKKTGEQIGVHGSYDIWGLTRAYSTGETNATAVQMQKYANTVDYEMTMSVDSSTGAATYSSFNDRCCDTSTYNYLPPGFIYLAPYNRDIYLPAAHADISGGKQAKSPILTAGILWAKHWLYTNP
ncbi:MAG: hypothetical protein P4K83_02720 [Terracidiphilus sp.]|nr:hypothetical protein [Terracidiphilus sp.]